MSESRGITLIVLIVTIVVLLILAGVTVAHITGGEGIIEQAQEKRDKTKIASEEAILGNVAIEATDKNGEITEANLRSALSKYNVEITPSGGLYRIVFKDSNNLYKMDHQGEFFYWEDMAPTDIYAKKDGTTLYLRSTQPDTSYVKGTQWNDAEITKVVIEEPIAPTTCEKMFWTCTKLQEIENIENLHTENSISMERMFSECENLKELNMKYFDTNKVTSLFSTFYKCKQLSKLNLTSFNTSNIQTMRSMFNECTNLKDINISSFNTSSVKTMYRMFYKCESLTELKLFNFNTNLLENMQEMFCECKSLKILDLSSFNTTKVTNMNSLFYKCLELITIFVGENWNTTNVGNSEYIFRYNDKLKGGEGTKYDSSNPKDLTYAHVDGGLSNPGYFTLKEN